MSDSHSHDEQAEAHHHDTHEDVADARAAVVAAVEAVEAADAKMDSVIAMLGRHFRLGLLAVVAAALIGGAMFYVVVEMRTVVGVHNDEASRTQIQTVANEVEVLRHRVNEREGHQRLCTIAMAASRPMEVAVRICEPVVGEGFAVLKGQLAEAETRLIRLRAEGA